MKNLLIALIILFPSLAKAKVVARAIADDYCSSVVAVTSDPTTNSAVGGVIYVNLVDSTQTAGTETAEDTYTVPVAMKASKLRVTASGTAYPSTTSYTVTLRDDAANTNLACTITSTSSCTDTEIVSIAAGSKLTVSVDATGTPTVDLSEALVSFCLTE